MRMKLNTVKKHVGPALLSILLAFGATACSPQATVLPSREQAEEEEEQTPQKTSVGIVESDGYDTPQLAVAAYLEGLKSMDLRQMMSAFAVESYVENYDFEANLERIRSYVPSLEIKLPNAGPLAKELNIESRKSAISVSISRQYLSLCYPGLDQSSVTAFTADDTPADFTRQFTESLGSVDLTSLKTLGYIPPQELSDLYISDGNKKNIAAGVKVCGADQIESCAVAFEIGGEKYLMCADTVKYGDKWYIQQLGGNISNILGISIINSGILPGSEWETGWESAIKQLK